MLDVFCTAYIDDILIYSNSKKEHREHVRKILGALRGVGLQADINKCEFHVTEVNYLSLVITSNGIRMDPQKVSAVQQWETPTCVRDVQSFIGFANFYRRFIQRFSSIVAFMIATVKKDARKSNFEWTSACQQAFDLLKHQFTTAPILAHFDYEKECIVETDASDNVSARVLSQYSSKDGKLHPVAFFSQKHSPQEINYEIYDKELLAIIKAFEEWRPMLKGAGLPIKILTDHWNLQYFMTTKQLSRRQARWSKYLSRFNFVIQFRPGKLGGKPNSLTRKSGDLSKEGDKRIKQMQQTVLKTHNLDPAIKSNIDLVATPSTRPSTPSTTSALNLDSTFNISADTVTKPIEPTKAIELTVAKPTDANSEKEEAMLLDQLLDQSYKKDPIPSRVLELLAQDANYLKHLTIADCSIVNGRLHYRGLLYIPNYHVLQLRLCKLHHNTPVAGHLGIGNTYKLLHRHYYWPNMQSFVRRYVRHCHMYKRSKGSQFKKQGVLQPLPVPKQRWQNISIDLVTGVPKVQGCDAILTVVDKLSKERHYIGTTKELNAEGLVDLFLKHVWKHHGFPQSIVSDRGSQFISNFWKFLCTRLGITAQLLTAWHPKTDGQTEQINGVMEQYLRSFVNYLQDDWLDWLPLAEFVSNNTELETTKVTPFFANKGFHPRIGFEPTRPPIGANANELNADAFATCIEEIQNVLRNHMLLAQADYEKHANCHRGTAPQYREGDLVWLDTRNLFTKQPCQKLENRRAGPYPVKQIVSTHAIKLTLPADIRVHPMFHVNLLEPAATNPPHAGHIQLPPPPIKVDGEAEWEVTAIVDSRYFGQAKKLQYRVQWTGYAELSWEDASNIINATNLLSNFHTRYPRKPGLYGKAHGLAGACA